MLTEIEDQVQKYSLELEHEQKKYTISIFNKKDEI